MIEFKSLGIKPTKKGFLGNKIDIDNILNCPLIVNDFRIENSKFTGKGNGKCLSLQITFNNESRVLFTGSSVLMDVIQQVPKEKFPFKTTIVKENKAFYFN